MEMTLAVMGVEIIPGHRDPSPSIVDNRGGQNPFQYGKRRGDINRGERVNRTGEGDDDPTIVEPGRWRGEASVRPEANSATLVKGPKRSDPRCRSK